MSPTNPAPAPVRDIICDKARGSVLLIGQGGAQAPPCGESDKEEVFALYDEALNLFRSSGEVTGALMFRGRPVRVTCGYPVRGRIGSKDFPVVYFRLQSRDLPEPETLGYPRWIVEKIARAKTGLVLVCGDQGAGKTTGICSLLRERVRMGRGNAVMFEAPSEYVLHGPVLGKDGEISGHVNQVSLLSERDFPEAAALSLRMASPATVMYGEIRVEDGVRDILSNALSSHLVMTTLHGLDIMSSLRRLLDKAVAGRPDYREYYGRILSEAFTLCIHQKLLYSGGKIFMNFSCLEADDECRAALYRGDMRQIPDMVMLQKSRREREV